MTLGTHYDPEQVTTYMADKTTVIILVAIATSRNWTLEDLDITSAYLHERFPHTEPAYIKQHPRFDVTIKNPCKEGLLIRNIYGTPQALPIYHTGLSNSPTSHGFKPTEADICIFFEKSHQDLILIAINIDEFLSVASIAGLQDKLHATL